MKRENYKRISGIIIDQCLQHGTYLDAGELDALTTFMKAGGQAAADFHHNMVRQRETQKQERAATRKKERDKRARGRTSRYAVHQPPDTDFSLWHMLTGHGRFFGS